MKDMKDLVVLVADSNMKAVLKTLLEKRQSSLGIRVQTFDVYVHFRHDPGVYHEAGMFLKPFTEQYCYALVLFDFKGSGAKGAPRQAEAKVQQDLNAGGWKGRSAAIAIVPELEAWVFSNSPHVVQQLAGGDKETYNRVLVKYGIAPPCSVKPSDPKEAMEELLRKRRRPRSSAIYASLAEKVSLEDCKDPAFGRLQDVLRRWLGEEESQ